MTTAFYAWAEIGGAISISRLEERQNAGEGRLINLLEKKIVQAEMTMTEVLNGNLLQGAVSGATFVPETSTAGNLGLLPMGYFLRFENATDPTVGGDVGNISNASNDWWRHRTSSFAGSNDTGNDFSNNVTSYAGLKVNLHRMQNFCGRGAGGSPDLAIGDQVSWETYSNALDEQVRYTDTAMADMGFDSVKLRGATFIWDEVVPDIGNGTAEITLGTVFHINTKFYKIVFDSETDVVTTPFIEPENQTAKTAKILTMGNATCSNLRKMGVSYDIAQNITG